MKHSYSRIKKIQGIVSAEQVIFNNELESKLRTLLPKKYFEKAKRNSSKVNVFRIVYKSQGHQVAGFIVEPKKLLSNMPVLIVNRGGYEGYGDFRLGGVFGNLAEMADWGYIVFASQLSGHPRSEGKDEYGGKELADIIKLYDLIKSHTYADHTRIGMIGYSRGGMMTYILLKEVKWIRAAVTVGGLSNLSRFCRMRPEMKKVFKKTFGGGAEEIKKRSAVLWANQFAKKTPLLLMHGTADWRVSPLDSLDLASELYKNKIPYRLIIFEGADHALSEVSFEADHELKNWIDRFVKNGETAPNINPHGK